jgi:hypothetical protein
MTQYTPDDQYRQRVQAGQNPLSNSLGAGIFGLGGIKNFSGGPRFGFGGPRQPRPYQPPYQQPPQILNQDPWGIKGMGEQVTGFGETLGGYGETLGGFEETLGGLGEQMGGYGERLGGFESTLGGLGEQMGGFGKQFGNISDRLGKIEEGIAGLNKSSPMQQQPPRSFYGGFNPYSMFGGLSSLFGGYGRGRGRYG